MHNDASARIAHRKNPQIVQPNNLTLVIAKMRRGTRSWETLVALGAENGENMVASV
jgi:hypothetical protein